MISFFPRQSQQVYFIAHTFYLQYNHNMKKVFILIFVVMFCMPTYAGNNVLFGDGDENSLSLYLATGTGSGSLLHLVYPGEWEIVPMTSIMLEYSQPMTIFRMPARMNLNIIQNIAYNSADGLSFFGGGISWDVAPLYWRGIYIGVGFGPYYRNNYDRWVSSRLVFGEKFFIGTHVSENMRVELFTLHFSNGDFTETNLGFNFAGLSIGYSF